MVLWSGLVGPKEAVNSDLLQGVPYSGAIIRACRSYRFHGHFDAVVDAYMELVDLHGIAVFLFHKPLEGFKKVFPVWIIRRKIFHNRMLYAEKHPFVLFGNRTGELHKGGYNSGVAGKHGNRQPQLFVVLCDHRGEVPGAVKYDDIGIGGLDFHQLRHHVRVGSLISFIYNNRRARIIRDILVVDLCGSHSVGGRIVEQGDRESVFSDPRHPYTRALLASAPRLHQIELVRPTVEGEPPSPIDIPTGCSFHPRCPRSEEMCTRDRPSLEPVGTRAEHFAACHFREEKSPEAPEEP